MPQLLKVKKRCGLKFHEFSSYVIYICIVKVKVKTDSLSASLSWCQTPIWDPRPNFPFLSLIIFRQLRVCWCEAPSLTRSRVCSFQFLPGIASAASLISESLGIHDHILFSLFLRLTQPGGPRSCIYFPQEQGSQVIAPDIGLYIWVASFIFRPHWPHRRNPVPI
jgi:hypothetical protein